MGEKLFKDELVPFKGEIGWVWSGETFHQKKTPCIKKSRTANKMYPIR